MGMILYNGEKEKVLDRIVHADAIVSDFDGTDVQTPLKRAAMTYLASPRTILRKPELVGWGVKAMLRKAMQGKDADSVLWEELSGILGEDTIDMIERFYQERSNMPDNVLERSVLSGVKDIYSQLPDAERFYISRNFKDIIGLYSQFTGVPEENTYTGERKGPLLEDIIVANPENRRYIIRGDSASDDEVLDVADFYRSKGAIDDYVGIAIGKSSHNDCIHNDIIVSEDQRPLAYDIESYKNSLSDDSS